MQLEGIFSGNCETKNILTRYGMEEHWITKELKNPMVLACGDPSGMGGQTLN